MADHPMGDFILPYRLVSAVQTGSSDMGDVSQIVPLVQIETACFTQGSPGHSWLWAAQGTSSYAMKGALFAGQVLSETAKQLMEHPEVLEAAREEQKRRMGGKPYVCPIPEEYRKTEERSAQ